MYKQLNKIVRCYWKSISLISCVLYLSFAPASTFKGVPTFEGIDKVVHFIMYIALSGVLIYDYNKSKKTNTFSFFTICLLFPSLLGGAIEIIQPIFFFPRSASWVDWMFDIAGVFVGWFAIKLAEKYFPLYRIRVEK